MHIKTNKHNHIYLDIIDKKQLIARVHTFCTAKILNIISTYWPLTYQHK